MTYALKILIHAFRMIFGNPSDTVKAVFPGLCIVYGAGLTLYLFAPDAVGLLINSPTDPLVDQNRADGPLPPSLSAALTTLVAILAMVVGFVVTIVIWHRYVLLSDEPASTLPPSTSIARYIGITILLGLIGGLVLLPILAFLSAIVVAAGENASAPAFASTMAAAILGWALTRYSLPLPAAAIGQKMRFTESWQQTAPYSASILWLTIGLYVLNQIIGEIVQVVTPDVVFLQGVVALTVNVLTGLISASVLTTLYGITVQGRALPD